MRNLLRTIQLLFLKTTFLNAEISHIRALNAIGRVMGDPDEFRLEAKKRIAKKRKGLLLSFLVIVGLVLTGFSAATAFNYICPLPATAVLWLRVASIIVIAWAVLGRIGYETATYGGETLLEITSVKAFKQFYGLGVFLATFGLFLNVPIA